MAIIYNYTKAASVDDGDLLIGTDNVTGLPTRNFSLLDIKTYVLSSAGGALTLTTQKTSGPASLIGGVLNIPIYSGGENVVTSIATTGPITGGPITGEGTIGINEASGSTDGFLSSTDWNIFNSKQSTSEKGQAGGYAPLDSSSKVPSENLPDSLVGAVVYQGTWNASTNIPALPTPAISNKGHYYIVSDAGTYLGIAYAIGDWAISNGIAWEKVDNTQDVNSVFGRQGNVVADANDYSAFYANINDAYSDTKVNLNLNVASAGQDQILSWSGTGYVWVEAQSGDTGNGIASTLGEYYNVETGEAITSPIPDDAGYRVTLTYTDGETSFTTADIRGGRGAAGADVTGGTVQSVTAGAGLAQGNEGDKVLNPIINLVSKYSTFNSNVKSLLVSDDDVGVNEAGVDHNALYNYKLEEHIDWTVDQLSPEPTPTTPTTENSGKQIAVQNIPDLDYVGSASQGGAFRVVKIITMPEDDFAGINPVPYYMYILL